VHLKFIAAKAAAVVALSCMASISVTTLAVYADANPNNHGHHYGQLKHQHPPVPAPQQPPVPKPNTPPVVPVGSHPNVSIAQTIAPPVSGAATLPLPDLGGRDKAPQNVVGSVPPVRDPNLWVVEALLPVLLIVWLIMLASAGALQNRKRAPAEQPA